MTTRTKTLGVANFAALGTIVNLYTCPSGHRAIVKDVSISNTSAATQSPNLYAQRAGVAYYLWVTAVAAGNVSFFAERFIVLEAGDSLHIFKAALHSGTAWVSGAELVVP